MRPAIFHTYDVIVVGLGAMGSATLYQLAKRGKRVLGIDRFDPPHPFGSSHGDSRITRQAIGEGEHYVPLALRSYEIWADLERQSGEELLLITGGLTIGSRATGQVRHGNPYFFSTVLDVADRHGVEHELLDAEDIRRRFPQFILTGTEVGYYEPMTGALRPERCVRVQLDLAEASGATIVRNERVIAVEPRGGSVRIRTGNDLYEAERAVIAAGSWLPSLFPGDFEDRFGVYRQVMTWFAIEGHPELFKPGVMPVFMWAFADDPDRFLYGFPAIDGPVAGVKVATEQTTISTTPETVQREVSPVEVEKFYDEFIAGHVAGLSRQPVKAVSCLYTVTPDSHFVIDTHPAHPEVMIVSPCSGHGFKHSPAIGEAVAETIVNGHSTVDLRPFALLRS